MPKDGLKPLAQHVVASLLRALMTLPAPRKSRLVLRRATSKRPPVFDERLDYYVMFQERPIGRIWMHDYSGVSSIPKLWHWEWHGIQGTADGRGDADSLEEAMAAFRSAWDSARESGVA